MNGGTSQGYRVKKGSPPAPGATEAPAGGAVTTATNSRNDPFQASDSDNGGRVEDIVRLLGGLLG
jgi:hypothetical protein